MDNRDFFVLNERLGCGGEEVSRLCSSRLVQGLVCEIVFSVDLKLKRDFYIVGVGVSWGVGVSGGGDLCYPCSWGVESDVLWCCVDKRGVLGDDYGFSERLVVGLAVCVVD